MKVAVEGCCHGELNAIYATLETIEAKFGFKVDLLICCGDFQTVRDAKDLQCLTCPPKYRKLCDFHEYYSGLKVAPVLTVFIGGNHEAPNVLRELYYGGWVAPNIFYMGHSGVINVGGLRIAALSGIYKAGDYRKGYFEYPPYDDYSQRSAYHIREFEVKKLGLLKSPIDIIVTHDWPRGIEKFGNWKKLLRIKPFFEDEISSGTFGNPVTTDLLTLLKPKFWFSAHLHVKFAALVPHADGGATRFLALDKVLPNRSYLQILQMDPEAKMGYSKLSAASHGSEIKQICYPICFDLEWLSLLKVNQQNIPLGSTSVTSHVIYPTDKDIECLQNRLEDIGILKYNHKHYMWPSWTNPLFTDSTAQRRYLLHLLGIPRDVFLEGNSGICRTPLEAAEDISNKQGDLLVESRVGEEEIDIDVDSLLDSMVES